MVFHLLALGRGRAQQGASSQQQVGTQGGQVFVHQEVFLLGAYVGAHIAGRGVAKELENTHAQAG